MLRVEFLQCAAAQQPTLVAHRPECDFGSLQPGHIEGVNTLRRGEFVHVAEMFFEQSEDIRPSRIVKIDAHTLILVLAEVRAKARAATRRLARAADD